MNLVTLLVFTAQLLLLLLLATLLKLLFFRNRERYFAKMLLYSFIALVLSHSAVYFSYSLARDYMQGREQYVEPYIVFLLGPLTVGLLVLTVFTAKTRRKLKIAKIESGML